MKLKHSIRGKITALLLAMVLTTLFLTGVVSLWNLYSMRNISAENSKRLGQTAAEDAEKSLEKMAGEQLLSTAKEKAGYIEQKFNTVISCVNGIAQAAEAVYQNPDSYPDRQVPLPVKNSRKLAVQLLRSKRLADKEMDKELYKLGNLQDLLVQYNANNDMISSTYLATKSGWMLQADYIAYSKFSNGSYVPDYYEAETRQWYQRALSAKKGDCVYTDVMEDIHEGKDCIVCAKAVYRNGQVVAVAGIGSYLDTVKEAVLNTTIGESGYAFLLNEKGQVMVSGAKEGETAAGATVNKDLRSSKNNELARVAEDMVKGGSALERLTLNGKQVYLAYAPLKELGWSFVTVIDMEEVIAPAKESQQGILKLADTVSKQQDAAIRQTVYQFFLIMIGAAVLICIISIFFSKKLTAPIRRLTVEVARIDHGNLNNRISIHTKDEVQELGNAFNAMTTKLQHYIENLAAATAEKERIRTELSLASKIQADMLPDAKSGLNKRKEFALYASMTPAKEVGGDFYDFFLTDEDHLAVLVGDVSGKGVPASLFMVVAKTLLRSRIKGEKGLAEAIAEVNNSLCAGNKNGMFVTAWIGVLTLSTGKLNYVSAGHNPPLLKKGIKGYEYIRGRGGFVLGGMEGITYIQKELQLVPEDILFLYTDGVSEANDEKGQLYGEPRLKDFMNRMDETEPKELAAKLWMDIKRFQGKAEQFDDITMLFLQYQGKKEIKKEASDDSRRRFKNTADLTQIEQVQAFVEKGLAEQQVSPEEIRRFLIASDEIVTNICRYSKASEFTVECSVKEKEAALVFADDGVEFNPVKRKEPDIEKPLEQRKQGGLGIYMVKRLMDHVSYERIDGKNRLTIIKKI